jgi:selenocysteine lyase/cysteine desulfurase
VEHAVVDTQVGRGDAEVLANQRELFDLPEGVTYLNCAYMAPQLRAVTAVGRDAVSRKAHPWEITPADFFADVERLRGRFGALVGGDADGVAVMPSVSYGISTAAAQLAPEPQQDILVLADQFPSNVYQCRELADRQGARLHTVPRPPDDDWTAALLQAVGDHTAVVAVPPCHWTDGTVVDLVAVGKAARSVGAVLVVDGTQAVGAMPLDIGAIEPDFLLNAAYKWLLGPYSLALAWIHPRWRGGVPLEYGWASRAGSEDFARLVDYTDAYRPGARRFDVGETANFALVPMAIAAIEQILAWGVDRIAATCHRMTDTIAGAAGELGLRVPPPRARSPHLIGVALPPTLPADVLSERLRAAQVHVSVRGDVVRISPHVYNDLDDIARLVDELREVDVENPDAAPKS